MAGALGTESEMLKREQCPLLQTVWGWWTKDETKPLVEVSVLCFLQCSDTIDWLGDRRDIQPI